ncbi:MAG: TRAP transporter substrate-binding protein [SAR324 cluster bacterium]|nr:TRAP transporter substrate-binding protein [SAR324 cluster bacterium]
MRKIALALGLSLVMATAFTGNVFAKKVLLKTPIAFPTRLPGLGTTIIHASKIAKRASGGDVNIKIYEPKKLVAPFEILDAVSTGKVQAGFTTAGYWYGKMKAAPLFSAVPFGPEAGEYLAWFLYGNGMKLYQEMYDSNGFNVKVLLCGMIAPETSGWFKKPINSVADLKGLSMRFFGLGGTVMNKLGVSTSLLPGGEIFPALEKGAIDATEFSMPAIDQLLGLHKIAKYNYFPGWHQQATSFELLVNKDVWNKMSNSQQAILEVACDSAITNSIAEGEAIQFDVMNDNVAKRGVKIMYWSDEMLNAFSSTWDQVAAEHSAEDAFFKKVWDDMSTFRKGYDTWQANAFLPRTR